MRTPFKIPLQTEVETYMKEKMGWPENFCKHYSEKFWNHYQASGWKLSSGNSIKDWKACFNSQWQKPKFKEEIEMLFGQNPIQKNGVTYPSKIVPMASTIKEIRELDNLLAVYRLHPTEVPFKELGRFYDYLKENKLLRPMYQKEVEEIKSCYPDDNFKCRCACVELTLKWYTDTNWTFQMTMETRLKMA